MPRKRRQVRIPADLRVEMGVQIDETGRDGMPLGVDLLPATCGDVTHGRNRIAIDRDIAEERGLAAAVDDQTVSNHEIV